MEITNKQPIWLNPGHPNYKRWKRGRELSAERAEVVYKIVSPHKYCNSIKILDLGSGEGGTSFYFSRYNRVISYDLNLDRLKNQKHSDFSLYNNISLINGKGELLPFVNESFDLIILQDVIEHFTYRNSLVKELKRVLKNNGLIYLSTPNKFSFFNLLSDPHWGIPLLALFDRHIIKKYFLHLFRKDDQYREDIAELLSLDNIQTLLKDFSFILNTKKIISLLENSSKGILWSNFHLFLYSLLKKSGLFSFIKSISNDEIGFINKYLTPTFYIIMMKKQE